MQICFDVIRDLRYCRFTVCLVPCKGVDVEHRHLGFQGIHIYVILLEQSADVKSSDRRVRDAYYLCFFLWVALCIDPWHIAVQYEDDIGSLYTRVNPIT